ncbi:YbaB/EbfC family nucleoid-associated protein [Candidatus Hepatobacter penaei]|uniref:YbaB/EbfC family nucleoid-associated protein n=1 Tax=Candidatus Hepatobacter penaei TaxID=1274402 RepID=UPI0004F39492|nr:YbaB/EbfC family nucleoid-associated protein [Candidatus Hepatobacter penaei]TGW14857.1 YbaB/EbfC family nucleoid-associated protein [bacterium NHP-B]
MNQFQDMMAKAQALQSQMMAAEEKVKTLTATGESGGGLVKVVLSGKGVMQSITIDPSLIKPDDKEVLEDLIAAAFTHAQKNMTALVQEEMQKATGGLSLPPGVKLPGIF